MLFQGCPMWTGWHHCRWLWSGPWEPRIQGGSWVHLLYTEWRPWETLFYPFITRGHKIYWSVSADIGFTNRPNSSTRKGSCFKGGSGNVLCAYIGALQKPRLSEPNITWGSTVEERACSQCWPRDKIFTGNQERGGRTLKKGHVGELMEWNGIMQSIVVEKGVRRENIGVYPVCRVLCVLLRFHNNLVNKVFVYWDLKLTVNLFWRSLRQAFEPWVSDSKATHFPFPWPVLDQALLSFTFSWKGCDLHRVSWISINVEYSLKQCGISQTQKSLQSTTHPLIMPAPLSLS